PADNIGYLPGSGHVTPATGEYLYQIPLELPAGRAGMKPDLALSYASRGQNGLLGVGFKLEGGVSSRITRCGKTIATEGMAEGIDLDRTDSYCLDGQKLIAVSGAYGSGGTEYRTEEDTFAKIVSYTIADDSEVTLFRVWRKDGRIRDYKAARFLVPNGPYWDQFDGKDEYNFAWLLDQEQDRSENAIRYTYDMTALSDGYHRGDVEIYPTQIDYTFQHPGGEPGYRSVHLLYDDRPDAPHAYVHGARVITRKRLRSIDIYAPNP